METRAVGETLDKMAIFVIGASLFPTVNFVLYPNQIVGTPQMLKTSSFAIFVEDQYKLTQMQFLIQTPLGNLTSVASKTSLA